MCVSGSHPLQLQAIILGPVLGFLSQSSLLGVVLDPHFLNEWDLSSNFQTKFIHGQIVHNHLLFCQHILFIK